MEVKKNIKTIILVQNYGCSGSLFFQSLLDGHSQFLSLPALHAHQLTNFYRENCFLERKKFISKFLEQHSYWFNPNSDVMDLLGLNTMNSDMNSHIGIDEKEFEKEFDSLFETGDLRDFIISVYLAYNILQNESLDSKKYLIFPIHSLPNRDVEDLKGAFAQIKVIYTIRDPLKNIKSMITHFAVESPHRYTSLLAAAIGQALSDRLNYYSKSYCPHGYIPYPTLKNYPIMYVSLESLHSSSEKTLREIMDFLHAPFEKVLLNSTFSGKKWNNRKNSVKINGFSPKINDQKYNFNLSSFDEWRLKKLIQASFSKKYSSKFFLFNFLKKIVLFLTFLWPFFSIMRFNIKIGWKPGFELFKKKGARFLRRKINILNFSTIKFLLKILYMLFIYIKIPISAYKVLRNPLYKQNPLSISPFFQND